MSIIRQLPIIFLAAALTAAPSWSQESASERALKALSDFFKFDVPYVPTPPDVAHAMLSLANAGPEDIVYDLGSGDGRIVIMAARDFGVQKGVGIDLDQSLIARAKQTAERVGLNDKVDFYVADIFETDFSDATVLTLYLLEKINIQLRPRILTELAPGSRVVSHHFRMGEWIPDAEAVKNGQNIYLWIVPADVSGIWSWSVDDQDYRLELAQNFQDVSGTLHGPNGSETLYDIEIQGPDLNFRARIESDDRYIPISFTGTVSGNLLQATMRVGGEPRAVSAIRTP